MANKYPPKGKISYKWLKETLEALANPMQEELVAGTASNTADVLRHLGLLDDYKIYFDDDEVAE